MHKDITDHYLFFYFLSEEFKRPASQISSKEEFCGVTFTEVTQWISDSVIHELNQCYPVNVIIIKHGCRRLTGISVSPHVTLHFSNVESLIVILIIIIIGRKKKIS